MLYFGGLSPFETCNIVCTIVEMFAILAISYTRSFRQHEHVLCLTMMKIFPDTSHCILTIPSQDDATQLCYPLQLGAALIRDQTVC